jgi:hypothetical protein
MSLPRVIGRGSGKVKRNRPEITLGFLTISDEYCAQDDVGREWLCEGTAA